MQLALSAEDAEFRDEMREFFTTKVPQEIRDAVRDHRELTKDQIVESQQILNAAGLAVPNWPVEWGGQDWTPLRAPHLARGDAARLRPDAAGVQRLDDRPGHRAVRDPGDEGEVPPEDREPRHLVVAGLLRARRRLRPRLPAHHRGPRRRRVRRQRPEDLDHAGSVRRLDLHPGPHRPRGEEAGRHLDAAHRHDLRGRRRPADRADRRRPRGQRGLVRRRAGPGRQPGRRGEPRVGLRQVPARQRAGRRRAGRRDQARARPGQGVRRLDLGRRRHPARRPAGLDPDRRARERAARPRADRAARGRQLRRRQAAPGVVGAQAQGHRAAAGGDRAGRRPRRPRVGGERRPRHRPALVGRRTPCRST